MKIDVGSWVLSLQTDGHTLNVNYRLFPVVLLSLYGSYIRFGEVFPWWATLLAAILAFYSVGFCWLKFMVSKSIFKDWVCSVGATCFFPPLDILGLDGMPEFVIFGLFMPLWWGAGRVPSQWNG